MRHASNQVSCRLLMSQRGTGLEADHGCVESLVLDQPSSLQSSVIVVVSWLEILNWPNWQFFFCVWFQWNLWTAFAQCCQTGLAHHSVLTKTTQTPFQHSQQMLLHVTQGFGQDFSQLWSSYHCTILYHHYNWIWDPWRTACGSFPLYGWEAGRLLCRFALCL